MIKLSSEQFRPKLNLVDHQQRPNEHVLVVNLLQPLHRVRHASLRGAAGAIEAVVCVKSILDQKVHVSANIDKVDPLIDLPIALETQTKKIDYVLSNSFGFGGQNCSILFKKYG